MIALKRPTTPDILAEEERRLANNKYDLEQDRLQRERERKIREAELDDKNKEKDNLHKIQEIDSFRYNNRDVDKCKLIRYLLI